MRENHTKTAKSVMKTKIATIGAMISMGVPMTAVPDAVEDGAVLVVEDCADVSDDRERVMARSMTSCLTRSMIVKNVGFGV